MSNLSELLPAGAGAKSADFVASGTLGSGVTVGLNSDGTVSAVSGVSEGLGTAVNFEAATTTNIAATFDSNSNKVVIAYRDEGNSNQGTAIVGTVSGTSISFGTPVVFETGAVYRNAAAFDPTTGKVIIAYQDIGNSQYGTVIVGTVSGTSISFGTPTVFEYAETDYISVAVDSNSKVAIGFQDAGNYNYAKVIVGLVSGTSVGSFGSVVTIGGSGDSFISVVYDSNADKIVASYVDGGNSNFGTARVGTISGTNITFGTPVVYESYSTGANIAVFDSVSNKIVIAYRDNGNSYYGTAVVGEVSGTSISFGTPAVFNNTGNTFYISLAFNSNANKTVIAYADMANSGYGTIVVAQVTGTSISFGSEIVFNAAASYYSSTVFDSNSNEVVISYQDVSSGYGKAIVFQNASSTNTSFIGITDQAIADTATGSVIVQGGVSEKVSGLTTGSDYYVQSDGAISTTVSSVPAGRALSSTSILLEG